MSPGVARLLLSFAVLVATLFVREESYGLLPALEERAPLPGGDGQLSWWGSNILAGLVLVTGWTAVWRRAVNWTTARVVGTLALALGAGAVGASLEYCHRLITELSAPTIYLNSDASGLLGGVLWLGGTALLWRDRAGERLPGAWRVLCPRCQYDMRGLREATCPECGSHYTLDGLLLGNQTARHEFDPPAARATEEAR